MKRPGPFALKWGAIGIVVLLTAFVFRQHVPFLAIALFYLCAVGIAGSLHGWPYRVLIYNLSFVLAAIGAFETYLWFATPASSHYEGTYAAGSFFSPHPDLGYAILPKERVERAILKTNDGKLIYDVTYAIDQHGLRKGTSATAPVKTSSDQDKQRPIFFFGCSFTFGEGISDDPFPQAFSKLTGARSINFGVPGYGPHQMLRALERDLPRAIEPNAPQLVVFTLLPADHLWRAAGRTPWDLHGPQYEIVDGKATYIGPFSVQKEKSPPPSETVASRLLARALFLSRIYANLIHHRADARATLADREKVLAILLAAKEQSARKYQARFVVVLWDIGDERGAHAEWFAQKLAESQIPATRISRILPQIASAEFYVKDPLDRHPNGKAHALVASAIRPFVEANIPAPLGN